VRLALISLGVVLILLGLAWPWITRSGLGHLPGDVAIERPGLKIYVPFGTSVLVSVILSLVLSLVFWFWRR